MYAENEDTAQITNQYNRTNAWRGTNWTWQAVPKRANRSAVNIIGIPLEHKRRIFSAGKSATLGTPEPLY